MPTGPRPPTEIFSRVVPRQVAGAYDRLLDEEGVPDEEAAGFVGGEDVKQALKDYGLARTIPDSWQDKLTFKATPVNFAVQAMFRVAEAGLADNIGLLTDLTRTAAEVHGLTCGISPDEHELTREIHDRGEIASVSANLINAASHEFLTVDTGYRDTHHEREFPVEPARHVIRGVTMRGIYDESFARTKGGRAHLDSAVERGEEVRTIKTVPAKFQVADKAAAMVALTPTASSVLLSHSAVFADSFRRTFRLMWPQASPWQGAKESAAEVLTPIQEKVLGLLGKGLNDKEIDSELKLNDGAANYQVREIFKKLRVNSRFQAGVAAHARGWVL
jgi:DNA-binding CsgD family transcriptional regulator